MTLAAAGAVLAYIPSPDQGVWYLGPVPIRAYALCIIAGIIIAVVWGERRFVARGGAAGTVTDVAVYAVPFGLVGGRLYHVATDWRTYFGPGGNPIKALEIWEGGLGIWGAVALGAVGAWIGCRRRGVPLPFFADAVAPGIVVAQAVGRLGNYFNQELYGAPTDLPWGLEIFRRVDPATGLADPLGGVVLDHTPVEVVHPTFLYELIINLVVAAVVVWADKRFRLGHGRAFAVYVVGYTLGRFFVEQMRTDQATRVFGDIRINTVVSAVVFLAGVAYLVLAPKGRETQPVPEVEVDEPALRDVEPGPDLRKSAARPTGSPARATATKVAGTEAATAVLETEQATTYIEREPAARPDAEPAPEQATEVIAREPAPSVFAAVEQDTEVLRVRPAAPAGTAPAEATTTAPAESDEGTDRSAAEPAAETSEPVTPEPVAEKPEPVTPEPVAEKPVPVAEKPEPVAVEPQETRPTGDGQPAEPVAEKVDEPTEVRPAAEEVAAEEAAAEETADEQPAAAVVAPAAEPTVAEPVAAGSEPVAEEPAEPAADEVAEREPAQAPAADEPVVGEQAAEKAGPAVTAVPTAAEEPAVSEPAVSEPAAVAPAEVHGSRAEGNPDDQPDDEDKPVEQRVGADRREE